MNTANNVYELQIIKKAIANHLDRILPSDANQALYLIQYKIDDLVWDISTSIYQQSGCKVNFSLVLDFAHDRIESLRMLAVRQAEEVRQKALEEEAIKIEQARREQEINERRKVEEERQKKEITKIRNICQSKGIDYEIFEKIKSITIDQLEVDDENLKLEASFARDLWTDCLDMEKLIMAVEEEFAIESLKHDFIKYRPLFSSAQEDEYVHSWVTVEDLVLLVQETIS